MQKNDLVLIRSEMLLSKKMEKLNFCHLSLIGTILVWFAMWLVFDKADFRCVNIDTSRPGQSET